jgi:hypothetical protein
MRSVIIVIAHVIGEQFVQVSFIESDNGVEQITAAASHPALSHSHIGVRILGGQPNLFKQLQTSIFSKSLKKGSVVPKSFVAALKHQWR